MDTNVDQIGVRNLTIAIIDLFFVLVIDLNVNPQSGIRGPVIASGRFYLYGYRCE
jgi:hypothetical protein